MGNFESSPVTRPPPPPTPPPPTPPPSTPPPTIKEVKVDTTAGAASQGRQIGFLKEAGVDPNEYRNNQGKIDKLVRNGVDYKDKKKRYWVDSEGRDCFAIYARGLDIDNSVGNEYWQWTTDGDNIETAEVVKTRWLGVKGSFRTVNLTQSAPYKVSFKLKLRQSSTMARKTVKLTLTLPDGTEQVTQAQLPAVSSSNDGNWQELEVGRFYMSTRNVGELRFAMEQLFESWETGLVIKSVEIKTM